ncbi:uncharacterized protein LOC119184013 isoform X1 [Rhipicephalus microplus]|uniref:uncharacterized protein LOC119184013 isoform X1 n=2 Tax=Rhipicephalus microplus TaxID=6941 RepID=UPI003F6D16D4
MQSKCLVTYGDRNVAVAFDEPWTGRDLIEHLKGLDMFSEVDASAIGLTRFDEDFDVFVDITEVDVIENKSRIKVRLTSQVRIADVLEESAQPSQPARTGAYCLPDVPPHIAWMVKCHQPGQYFVGRSRVLQWLHHDLYLYDMYPGKLYTEAARALITRFPNLADVAGTGYDSWREALRFKAKYERKKMKALTKENTERIPRKKKPTEDECTAPRRTERPSVRISNFAQPCRHQVCLCHLANKIYLCFQAAVLADAEDAETIAGHVLAMTKEVAKARPDMAYIEDCMSRTLPSRREWVSQDSPSVDDIIKKYPALLIGSIVQLEFRLLTKVPIMEKLEEFLGPASGKIVKIARQKRHMQKFLEDLDAVLVDASEDASEEVMLTAAICVLPAMVKERMDAFICKFDPTKTHYVPTVTFMGNVLTSDAFAVRLEDIEIAEKSLLAAISTQMALYWATNIVFDKKAQRTFDVLSRALKVKSGLRPTPLVSVTLTTLSH